MVSKAVEDVGESGFGGETRSISKLEGREVGGVGSMKTNPGKDESL